MIWGVIFWVSFLGMTQPRLYKRCCTGYCETQISKTNNLRVTIGELKFASRIESQISEAQRTDICWTNYPIVNKLLGTIPHSGGYNTTQIAAEFFPKLALGFHTRDCLNL